MKTAIIAPIAFAIGVAGGTFLAPAPAPVAAPHTEDSSHVATPPAPGAVVPHGEDSTGGVTPSATPADAHATPETPAADTGKPAAFDPKHLAGILDKLPPADIPPLLSQFTDIEVAKVLGMMEVSRAAQVIAAFPKEKGAAISRLLLSVGRPQ